MKGQRMKPLIGTIALGVAVLAHITATAADPTDRAPAILCAEPRRPGDALQRPLRSRFRARLTPGAHHYTQVTKSPLISHL